MAHFAMPMFPAQIIDCMTTGRAPTVQELFVVAERIWSDGAAKRSHSRWSELPIASPERIMSLRAAQLALSGVPEVDVEEQP